MRRFVLFFSALLFSIGFVSCREGALEDDTVPEDDLVPREDIVLTRTQAEYIEANNTFALDLFRRISAIENGEGVLLSPISLTFAFGMVNNGAAGQTKEEIDKTLGFGTDKESLNDFCSMMLSSSAKVDPSTTIEIANSAVVNSQYASLKDSFTKTIEKNYGAYVCYKNFSKDDVKGLINSWCGEKTHGMIPELLKEQVDPSEYAHFLNATYFKGIWSSKFNKSDTRKEEFTLWDGSKVKVNMMRQTDKFSYSTLSGMGEALCLPYGNQAYRMIVILPEKGLEETLSALSLESWNKLISGLSTYKVDVKLPSFESEYNAEDLKDILQEMGIKTAFSNAADFSGMTETPIHISNVIQKTKIKVDEQGSEAAAVTDITMKGNSIGTAPELKFVEFHADRPFIYAITEVSTGAIFFIGQYTGK